MTSYLFYHQEAGGVTLYSFDGMKSWHDSKLYAFKRALRDGLLIVHKQTA